MTKKLILITVAALGLLYSEASLAKVCRLGDLSCDTNGFYGVGEGECDSSYKTCANPRAGATFCYAGDEAKYKDNDCCSTLVANEGYQECSIDDALVGYGKSCKGAADNITYWQYCGCSYGFVEVDGTNDPDDKALLDGNGDPIVNLDGNLVPYEARCAWDSKLYGGKCRFSQCNTDRRFFFENTGEYCKYRQETRCGGFGCMQVYDCNHDELNTGKEYYRNDSAQLAGGWDNFIPYLSEDQMTNEKDASGTVQLIKALNTTGNGLVTEDYNLTNKIVCSYAQSDGSGNDTGNGLNCNDVPNYCYLWTGCNNVRKWYSNHVNEGVIYDSEEAYLKWMEIVENQKGYNYSAQYVKNNPYHDAFYADVNPGYGTYTKNGNTYDAVNNSSCIKGIGCRITSANNGCTYITTNCHQDDAQHQCWKKISCSEENRFYSSFINASNVDNKTGKQELYLSSLNAPYWDEFYTGLQDKEIYPACLYEINECNDASGCYKKIGCETNFEDIRDHEDLENDWYPWFGDIRALCNDATRCYRATSCEPSVGAYSSRPNTSFFVTISSTATGLTCFRGQECYLATGSYTSVPNTSFFVTINSYASGSTCYRGQNCYIAGGAYSSSPNTAWFYVESSIASGSTCYRGEGCKDLNAGAYSSEPNTSFFYTINSFASGSGCYRGSSCNTAAGAYSSSPNTSFFITISSSATGSTAYRGEESHIAAGAYSSKPNTSFFITISSLASGSTSYRGESTNPAAGAYTSTPNTSFFYVISSSASGSTAYRGQESHIAAGAYSSHPNTSFFITISSLASGSTSYRGESSHIAAGAYTSTPNTSYFIVIQSSASGSISYRGESANPNGSYTSRPNTSFFLYGGSLASGSTAYRGSGIHTAAGAYSSTPNTSFFYVIYSLASGSTSYRGESSHIAAGAYSSMPNTSFFNVIYSLASGSTSYRSDKVHIAAGAYSSHPNTSFFHYIQSLASGSTSYRADRVADAAVGAYTSTPNSTYFVVHTSYASGSTCYRGAKCAQSSAAITNTSFFVTTQSSASGSTCYRAQGGCRTNAGAYTSAPNSSFFNVLTSSNAGQHDLDSTCYRGGSCATTRGAYSSYPNTSFFNTSHSIASGSTCYRGESCRTNAGAYVSSPNSQFFDVITSSATGITCYRGQNCALGRGAYSSYPNTSFFNTSHSIGSGSRCYRGESCRTNAGAYVSSPNSQFFDVITSYATGVQCYRGQNCAFSRGAYASVPNTNFFHTSDSYASGSRCYRAESCVYNPNQYIFNRVNSISTGKTCYRASTCRADTVANNNKPHDQYFNTTTSSSNGVTCKYSTGQKCNDDDTVRFTYGAKETDVTADGVKDTAKYLTGCNTANCWSNDSTKTTSIYFSYMATSRSDNCSHASGNCYKYTTPKCTFSDTTRFTTASTTAQGGTAAAGCSTLTATWPNGCNDDYYWYSSLNSDLINKYFAYTSTSSGVHCSQPNVKCYKYTSPLCSNDDTTHFTYSKTSVNGGKDASTRATLTAYYPSGCRGNGYACSDTPGSYFTSASYTTTSTSGCGHSQTCYIPNNGHCNYSNSCSSYFNCDDDSWCGLTCYKSTSCNNNNDYYSESQQSSYFNYTKVATADNGTICYKANSCVIDGYNSSGCVSTHFKNTSINAGSQGNASNCCTVRGEPKDSCFVTSTNEQLKYYSYDNGKTCCETTSYKITGCKGNGSYNNSYVSNSITYNYRVGSTPKAKNYRYGEAFKEKTTRSEGISCNSYANCYIGCSCASGWKQGTVPSNGEYVWATDSRYTGVNSLSVGSGLNASGTIDAQSASSGISASGLGADSGANISAKSSGSGNYSVSTMGTSGGMTCYKKACPDGYYLDAPNSTYFEYTTSTGPVELTCYKATGCKDGYATTGIGSAVASYHGFSCYEVPFDCKGWAEANGKASGIVWSSYTTSSTYMGNMKGPATLANEFPECANYETPTVTFTERVSISNATVDSVNLKFTSSDRMETYSFEKHHCCDGRPSGCTSGMPDCSDTDMASQRGCCPVGGNCYWGNNAVVSGTLVLRNTNISTNNTSYGVSTAYSQYSGGTIELQGNVTVNGVLSTEGYDGINGYRIHKGHLKVTSGNNFVKKFRVYGGYNSGATGTISAGAGLKTDDLYAYNLFSNGQGWNIQCSMFVYGALKLTGEYSPTNGCTVIYNGGYFEASSLKSYSSSVGTYEGKIVWNSGAQVQINGTCRKATSGGDVTVRGNDRITTNPVSGGSCSKADFITKL